MTIKLPKIYKPNLNLLSNTAENYLRAQKGTLIFAAFNIALTGAICVCLTVWLIWFSATKVRELPSNKSGYDAALSFVFIGAIIMLLFFSLIAFVFACFLIDGICKKKPQHVKVYFIYGCVVVVLSASGIVWSVCAYIDIDMIFLVMMSFVLVLYSMILSMIRVAYKSLEQEKILQGNEQLLVGATDTPNKV